MNDEFSIYQNEYSCSLSDDDLKAQLKYVLESTDLSALGEKYEGKVRDSYVSDGVRYLVTSDRLSCFDVVLTSVPFKGQVLNQIAVDWFKRADDIISNHLIDVPHPNVMAVREVEIIPIEVVVRGYVAGSAWRDYEAGKPVSGITLPEGLKMSERLPEPLLTPSTKAERGEHDEPISEDDIIKQNLVEKKTWHEVREKALALFAMGQKRAAEQGLILVDTKYEFGLLAGKVVLADEIHTLDSSRYWIESSYQEHFAAGEPPRMVDKEPTRQWLLSKGYKGNGAPPAFTDEHRIKLARHYISSFEQITGTTFSGEVEDINQALKQLRPFSS